MSATPTRRALLGASAALIAGGSAVATINVSATVGPDAALIALCDKHIANLRAYNEFGGNLEYEDDPLWAAYEETLDQVEAASPQTLDGLIAKAKAAKAEARNPGCTEDPSHSPAAKWAWQLLNDLLRVHHESLT